MSCCLRRINSIPDIPVSPALDYDSEAGIRLKSLLRGLDDNFIVFEEILQDQKQYALLTGFCIKCYCHEHLQFISEFMQWRGDQTELGAKWLLNNYICSAAEQAINVEGGCYERISELLGNYQTNKVRVFDELEKCFNSAATTLRQNYKP